MLYLALMLSTPLMLSAQDGTTEQLALQYYNEGEFEKAAEL